MVWGVAGVYDEKVLVGLDFVLNEASKRGIRIVLVLTNYWAMYGGIDQYNVWSFEAGSGESFLTSSVLSAKVFIKLPQGEWMGTFYQEDAMCMCCKSLFYPAFCYYCAVPCIYLYFHDNFGEACIEVSAQS